MKDKAIDKYLKDLEVEFSDELNAILHFDLSEYPTQYLYELREKWKARKVVHKTIFKQLFFLAALSPLWPIIGAGLFVDNEVGGACATGLGEAVLKTLGSFLIVELMRNGMTPQAACEEAVMRIVRKQDYKNFQIGYLAIDKKGNYGAYAIHEGFNFAFAQNGKNKLINAKFHTS